MELAKRLDIARGTVNRWLNYPERLARARDPETLAKLAHIFDCSVGELYDRPDVPSLDAIVEGAPDDVRQTAADIVRRLVGRR